MLKIVATRKNKDGDFSDFKLDNNQEVSLKDAINLAKNGNIENVIVGTTKTGSHYLRAKKDDNENNNLSDLPNF